jgi:Ala-tRNA(Pro) deacylase
MPSEIYSILKELSISFHEHHHEPFFTVEEGRAFEKTFRGGKTKNLFLRNQKGDRHFLVVIEAEKRADLKQISTMVKEQKLSFASSERLMKYLGVTPGSVTILGLINDQNHEVKVIIDEDFMDEKFINVHPLRNDATLEITISELKKFLTWAKNEVSIMKL